MFCFHTHRTEEGFTAVLHCAITKEAQSGQSSSLTARFVFRVTFTPSNKPMKKNLDKVTKFVCVDQRSLWASLGKRGGVNEQSKKLPPDVAISS